jgi:hypothetical protein
MRKKSKSSHTFNFTTFVTPTRFVTATATRFFFCGDFAFAFAFAIEAGVAGVAGVGFTTCTVRRRPPRFQGAWFSFICAIQD